MKILLGVTGSVASILTPAINRALVDAGHEVQIVATEQSLHFWKPEYETVAKYQSRVLRDEHEWPAQRYKKGDEVLHIELRKWADLLLIAPLSANTLAKMANGMCDNLLTSVVRAWDNTKPFLVAPAMNTHMWEHPVTRDHLAKLDGWFRYFVVVNPVPKKLACGDIGIGALADIPTIVEAVDLQNIR